MNSNFDRDEQIEHDLRAAFRVAASGARPGAQPTGAATTNPAARRRHTMRRWVAPVAAAAVVAAVAIGVPVLAGGQHPSPGTNAASPGPSNGASGAPDAADDDGTAAGGGIAAGNYPDLQVGDVPVRDGRATVVGISFPVPDGDVVWVTATSTTEAAVCVAAQRSPSCDGVILRMAVPYANGGITPIRGPLAEQAYRSFHASGPVTTVTTTGASESTADATSSPADSSSMADSSGVADSSTSADHSSGGTDETRATPITTSPDTADTRIARACGVREVQDLVGGRPARQLNIPCPVGIDIMVAWFVTDGSLAISAPFRAADEAQQIAEGIDFSGYAHSFGPVIFDESEASQASATSVPADGAPMSGHAASSAPTR